MTNTTKNCKTLKDNNQTELTKQKNEQETNPKFRSTQPTDSLSATLPIL